MPIQKNIVTGHKVLDLILRRLPTKVQKKVVRQSMRAGLKIIQAEVKSNLPKGTGQRDEKGRFKGGRIPGSAVKVRATKARARNKISLDVRISGRSDPDLKITTPTGYRYFRPAIEEYGDRNHAPNPFMRRSYESKGRAARDETMRLMLRGAIREALKL